MAGKLLGSLLWQAAAVMDVISMTDIEMVMVNNLMCSVDDDKCSRANEFLLICATELNSLTSVKVSRV